MKNKPENFLVDEGTKVKLNNYDPAYTDGFDSKEEAQGQLAKDIERLGDLQQKLYAANRHSILIIFQAMDAAGKDGVIKHVMSGINPQGCQVYSFKHPSDEEYEHDFLWRHQKVLPQRGNICIFNRSHYENVLVCKVHPELVLAEKLPGIKSVKDIDKKFWKSRYEQICRFEQNITQSGTVIIKFFLHLSKEEQRERLLARIDNPDKNWKFSYSDINERNYWDDYQKAYEDAISHTTTQTAPWYIIPADNKWFTRAVIAKIIADTIEALKPEYPQLPDKLKAGLKEAKKKLLAEK